MATIVDMLEKNAQKYPNDVALIELRPSKSYRQTITWKEFDDNANRIANYLAVGLFQGSSLAPLWSGADSQSVRPAGSPVRAFSRWHRCSNLGGWETLEMVQRYAHLSADHLAHWVTRLTELQGPKLAAI